MVASATSAMTTMIASRRIRSLASRRASSASRAFSLACRHSTMGRARASWKIS